MSVVKIGENNKQTFIDSLRSDIVRHVFAFYDVQYETKSTTVYAAFKDGKLDGYILIYTAMDFPSVVIECEGDTAERLIKRAPENEFILHSPLGLLPIIREKFPDAKHYVEDWMLVNKGGANLFRSERVRRLRATVDASKLVTLLESREDRTPQSVRRFLDWTSRMPLYGVFINDELVAYSGSFIQMPEVWMIGGVYTHPHHRNKGYSTLATSAITEEALRNSEAAALFVRSDNYPAIRVYEKLGYRKIGEKLWVDVGTGRKP